MHKIRTMNSISPLGLGYLTARGCEAGPDVREADALLIRSADLHEYEFGNNILAIGRAGAGYNNIPVEECAEKGIVVFNSPGANAEAVKEQEVMSLIMASRDVLGAIDYVRSIADRGEEIPLLVEKGKSAFAGPELLGKTLGVIGLGAIGALVANIALEFGMTVYGYDPFMSVEAAWRLSREVKHAESLDDIFRNSDYISLNVPYTSSTHHLLNAESFAKMKQGVRIINESRAEVVDDEAMTAALDTGRVGKYVTDFPNEVILKAPNVIALPHIGACTPESEDRCAEMAAAELYDYLENGNVRNSVNLPNASLPRMGVCRLCVFHRNVPKMLTKILDFISERDINVEHMINKPRGDYAYTIIDLGKKIGPRTADAIRAMPDILRVRVIYAD